MKRNSIIIIILCFFFLQTYAQSIEIVPIPSKIKRYPATFNLSQTSNIQDFSGSYLPAYLQNQLYTLTGLHLTIEATPHMNGNTIKLLIDKSLTSGDEGYELLISEKSCLIKAKTQAGLFYGIQSLLQLLPLKTATNYNLPCLKIEDSPRFPWRGMHLDVSRHFFSKEFIFKYLDLMAIHKMNVFHWHLVDDQGWRIEIKRYPRLTELGAWREDDTQKPWSYFVYPSNDKSKKLYGGYYSQSDIKEIVNYAKDRQITIIPEIEMPGHCAAMIEAYPELSCERKPWRKDEKLYWDFSNPLCAGSEYTFEFMENVLGEVLDLFPSEYIHIGGDECKKTTWIKCEKCQARIKKENLIDENGLQSYFIRRIEKFLNSKGRKIIGWDEILDGGLAPNATVMSWRGMEGGIKAARQGHNVVLTPDTYCYFDAPQFIQAGQTTNAITLEKVYSFNPTGKELSKKEWKYIIGTQGNVWTENMNTSQKVEEMIIPRISALSEVLWSKRSRPDYTDFLKRMNHLYPLFRKLNYNFLIPTPNGMQAQNIFVGKTSVRLSNTACSGKIYYTTDGTAPNTNSKLYQNPIEVVKSSTIKALTILPNSYQSTVITGVFNPVEFSTPVFPKNLYPGLSYTLYNGLVNNTSMLNTLSKTNEGTISTFKLPEGDLPLNFGVEYTGYIQIRSSGIYTFYTTSDDGSLLFVSDKLVVNNDGTHGPKEEKGEIALKAGYHKIKVRYFQAGGGKSFSVMMQTPRGKKSLLSESILKHN